MEENVYGVILAGGSGTRFWPKSTHEKPKQLCKIGDQNKTMIEKTIERIESFIPTKRVIIVTHQRLVEATSRIVHEKAGWKAIEIIGEPEAKNTAPALLWAAKTIQKKAESENVKNPVMISLHADHIIPDANLFKSALGNAVFAARQHFIALMGIKPSYPETGYGYIESGDVLNAEQKIHAVKAFKEKPDAETALRYFESGNFLWNSGIFCWEVEMFIEEMRMYQPALTSVVMDTAAGDSINTVYKKIKDSLSIDHALLEKSSKLSVCRGEFAWFDVGSWDGMDKCFGSDKNANYISGDIFTIDTEGCTIDSDGAFVAVMGMKDTVVAVQNGQVLVCPKRYAQRVKEIVQFLDSRG